MILISTVSHIKRSDADLSHLYQVLFKCKRAAWNPKYLDPVIICFTYLLWAKSPKSARGRAIQSPAIRSE